MKLIFQEPQRYRAEVSNDSVDYGQVTLVKDSYGDVFDVDAVLKQLRKACEASGIALQILKWESLKCNACDKDTLMVDLVQLPNYMLCRECLVAANEVVTERDKRNKSEG
jgi:hypothetical protein